MLPVLSIPMRIQLLVPVSLRLAVAKSITGMVQTTDFLQIPLTTVVFAWIMGFSACILSVMIRWTVWIRSNVQLDLAVHSKMSCPDLAISGHRQRQGMRCDIPTVGNLLVNHVCSRNYGYHWFSASYFWYVGLPMKEIFAVIWKTRCYVIYMQITWMTVS